MLPSPQVRPVDSLRVLTQCALPPHLDTLLVLGRCNQTALEGVYMRFAKQQDESTLS